MGHLPHVYIEPPWSSVDLHLPEATDRHLARVLRRSPGDPVTYTDGRGSMGRGSYVSGAVRRGEEWQVPAVTPELVLAVAPPRSIDRLRFIVEKAAELDVAAVQWLRTGRSEGRVPRYEKLAAWAIGALEQSSGAWRMNVAATQSSIDDVVVADRQQSLLLVADAAGMPIAEMRTAVDGAPRIVVAIGPEGGFVADEVPAGATRVALGDRILRVETAAVAAAAVLRLG